MEHITTLLLKIPVPDGGALSSVDSAHLAPFLQGVLMEGVDDSYAQALHGLPFNPYSQYCILDDSSRHLLWRVSALTDEAAERIVEPLYRRDSFTINKFGAECTVDEKSLSTISLQSITGIIDTDVQGKSTIEFVTPTAFRSGGRYAIVPTIRLMFQNLLMRYGYVYGNDKEVEEEVLDYFEEHLVVSAYSLRSRYFSNVMQEGGRLPAFLGSLTLSASGPRHQIGLMHMLLKFGEYSGIGIKTSMGMGGMRCS